jgi:hypothetical protein
MFMKVENGINDEKESKGEEVELIYYDYSLSWMGSDGRRQHVFINYSLNLLLPLVVIYLQAFFPS